MIENKYPFDTGDIVIPSSDMNIGNSLYYRVENSTQEKVQVKGIWWYNSYFKLVFRPTFTNVNTDTLENIVNRFIKKGL